MPAIEAAFPGTTGPKAWTAAKLGGGVRQDAALARLEAIVHPAVADSAPFFWPNSDAPLVVFDIPLLFERTGGRESMPSRSSPPPPIFNANASGPPGMTEEKFADPGAADARCRQTRFGRLSSTLAPRWSGPAIRAKLLREINRMDGNDA
jgi:dephospho-CoA kinase